MPWDKHCLEIGMCPGIWGCSDKMNVLVWDTARIGMFKILLGECSGIKFLNE